MNLTPEESTRLKASIQAVHDVLNALPRPDTTDAGTLEEAYKVLHTSSVEPWCILCEILRSRVPSNLPSRPSRPTINDFL